RFGVFGFHHYHATAHEALGVFQGRARLQLGGPEGMEVEAAAGDVLVLPAGVAHKCLASEDFVAVGAYPAGQDPDMNRGDAGERPAADERIAAVPLPPADPVAGADGPLRQRWGAGQP
ncbi:MAG TPA: cupin domain-containing protein, partial [Gammaproteobacteria bacterium]|nr:cupin domain-containing protein [Gammaproteobacteria bacterium]